MQGFGYNDISQAGGHKRGVNNATIRKLLPPLLSPPTTATVVGK